MKKETESLLPKLGKTFPYQKTLVRGTIKRVKMRDNQLIEIHQSVCFKQAATSTNNYDMFMNNLKNSKQFQKQPRNPPDLPTE